MHTVKLYFQKEDFTITVLYRNTVTMIAKDFFFRDKHAVTIWVLLTVDNILEVITLGIQFISEKFEEFGC